MRGSVRDSGAPAEFECSSFPLYFFLFTYGFLPPSPLLPVPSPLCPSVLPWHHNGKHPI